MSGDKDYLGMSDNDFLNMTPPSLGSSEGEESESTETPETTPPEVPAVAEEEVKEEGTQEESSTEEEEGEEQAEEQDKTPAKEPKGTKEAEKTQEGNESKEQQETAAPDYEGFYKKIMAPFKANGKTIELKDPEEAIQLMQMGANYTRKMQAIQPHRKVLLMLENNGLLDEGKLSFLIDIEKKNPEAIKKLLKDSGIDPLDVDTTTEPAYTAGNHRVSDEEAGFRSALDDLGSTEEGKTTLRLINSDWDQASKEALWKSPEIMTIMHQQRESGIYERIANEIGRQKLLGTLPSTMPFLQAYKTVGDQLTAANGFADLVTPASTVNTKQPAAVVTTRVQAPKSTVKNSDKATAAAPSRNSPKKAEVKINPLAMSDEDFLKQMANRL